MEGQADLATWRPVLALPFCGTVTRTGCCPLRRVGGRMILKLTRKSNPINGSASVQNALYALT